MCVCFKPLSLWSGCYKSQAECKGMGTRGSDGVIPGLSAEVDQSPSSITEKESGFLLPPICSIQALSGWDDAHLPTLRGQSALFFPLI